MTSMLTWLEALVAAKGSDLHLKVGSPPRMRVDGRLVMLEDALGVAGNPHDLQVALRSQGLVAERGRRLWPPGRLAGAAGGNMGRVRKNRNCGILMSLTVLINAGPWLPVPPPDYGGIENVLATLIPELRARGVEVVLCTVEESTVAVDDRRSAFPDGQFGRLAGPYAQVMGITHAHMATVLETLRSRPDIDLVHDHLEVVGPSVLGAIDGGGPPVLQTLHWDLRKHPEFYGSFDGKGRVFFNAVSNAQLDTAPANLRGQTLGAVHLGVDLAAHRFRADKGEDFLVLGRVTPFKGQAVAARICKELGVPLVLAGPVAGVASPRELAAALRDPASPLHGYGDVRHYLDAVQPFEDGERIRWVGTVGGADKDELVGRARAVLMPISWEEPGATAAIEALACGTPVIATRRGALPEIIEHGRNGFLADDDSQFARLLPRAGEIDPAACRRSVEERFSSGAMAEGYLRLYREVLTRSGT